MITDILTIGPGLDPNGQVYQINAATAQNAFNSARDHIKSEMSDNDGADIYVYPSSTGEYIFTNYAQFDIPVRIHWPANTLAKFASGDSKMFRFYGSSSSVPRGSAIYGLRADATFSINNCAFVVIDDQGYEGACSHITLRDCWFKASAQVSATDLQNCVMVTANGASRSYRTGHTMTTGLTVDNCKFMFGYGGQMDYAWTDDTEVEEVTATGTVYSSSSVDNSFNRDSGSFLTDGLDGVKDIGRWIKISGFSAWGANVKTFRIVSVTATKIVLTDDDIDTQSAGDSVTWTRPEVTPKPYGIQGLRVANISSCSITHNRFNATDGAYQSDSQGRTAGCITMDNCIWSAIAGNRALNLTAVAASVGTNGTEWEYAADIFAQLTNAPTEGAHSLWWGNYVENTECRYCYNIDDGKYDIVVLNGAGRQGKCRAAFRVSGFDEILGYSNPHNINGINGHDFYHGHHVRWEASSNCVSGPFMFGVGNTTKSKLLYQKGTPGNIVSLPYDAVSQSFC